jgi:hypothetical protein
MSSGTSVKAPVTIAARFVLDQSGRPEFIEKNGRKHYWIDLSFDPAGDKEIRGVTFTLDPNKYSDPVRLVEPHQGFTERITSRGDFPVIAQYESDDFHTVSGTLGQLLRRGHPEATRNPDIDSAISDIINH